MLWQQSMKELSPVRDGMSRKGLRILWLKTELLHPVDKGGKIRTYQMLKALRREHHITYVALDDGTAGADEVGRASEYCDEIVRIPFKTRSKFSAGFYGELALNLGSRLPYFIQKYKSRAMLSEVDKRVSSGAYDLLVCDFLAPSVNLPEKLGVGSLLFQHNVEAMIWKRHYEVQRNPVKKAYLYDQWRKAFAYEREVCRRFDMVVTVSREDAETIQHDYGLSGVSDVPTGVDTEYFRPNGKSVAEPHGLVFTGSMDWLPNEDAIQFFTRDIMPLIKVHVPNLTLTVVGRNPYQNLLELSRRDPSIVVTGRVSDVRPFLERAMAYIVPIRVGGGTRLKIYEAMAMEKPVISTTVGAEGLPLNNGTDLILADTPAAFADAVVRVLRDPILARGLAENGAATVRQNFGWKRVADEFAGCCIQTVEARRRDLNVQK